MNCQKENTIKMAMEYHIKNNIPFTENVFKTQTELSNLLFAEAKVLHSTGKYVGQSSFEDELLNSDIGEFGIYRNKAVPLDFPIIDKRSSNNKRTFFVYIKDLTCGKIKKIIFNEDPNVNKKIIKKDKSAPDYWSQRLNKFLTLMRFEDHINFR
jgi:hypothetical protein